MRGTPADDKSMRRPRKPLKYARHSSDDRHKKVENQTVGGHLSGVDHLASCDKTPQGPRKGSTAAGITLHSKPYSSSHTVGTVLSGARHQTPLPGMGSFGTIGQHFEALDGHAARAYHHKVHTMIKHAPFSKNTHLRNISLTAPKSLAYILSTWSPDKHVNFTHTPSIELVDSAKYNGGTNA
eukprot:1161444-Pelagomonas_calceolata.AAC.9